MAIIVFTNALVLVNAVDLSDHCTKTTVTDDRDQVSVDAMGSGYHQMVKGLGTAQIDLDLLQDYAAAKVHATLQPLIGSSTPIIVEVRPVNAARSATNPGHVLASALLFSYVPLDTTVGTPSSMTATFINAPGGTGMTYPIS